jgi:predicted kinase
MNQLTVILTVGTPASGKSTWAKSVIQSDPENWVRFSNDDLRVALNNNIYSPSNEKLIKKIRREVISNALKLNKNVIVDNVNLPSSDNFKEVCSIVKSLNIDCKVEERPFFCQLEEVIERDSKRTGYAKVGPEVIKNFWNKLGKDKFIEYKARVEVFKKDDNESKVIQNPELPKAVVCDLDGTFAKIGNRSPYDASKCDETDLPNWPVINTVKAMKLQNYHIVFASGREEKDRAPSQRFIEKYIDFNYNLYMRKTGDPRKDFIIKEEMYNNDIFTKYNVLYVLDDRKQVVNKLREMGLTVFQVAEGNF